MDDFGARRRHMVERHLAARGIRDARVLAALAEVPREAFVPESLAEFAYDDTALPIEEKQTISQPYIVAAMAEALELAPQDRVLEVGAGSGYAAAVLSRIAAEVWAIERHAPLAELARGRFERLGYDNAHLIHGDGTRGLPERAPFDAIAVAAGGPEVPPVLLEQLADGGRLVIPVGPTPRLQTLVRIRRRGAELEREELGPVAFVPLVGSGGWAGEAAPVEGPGAPIGMAPRPPEPEPTPAPRRRRERPATIFVPGRKPNPAPQVAALLREAAEPIDDLERLDLSPLLERIGDSRVVLIGEASHGTSEFYRFRARITRELIARKGFAIVAVEADWPDAAWIDRWVRPRPGQIVPPPDESPAFERFPTWMWRNREVRDFVHWLREHNAGVREPERRVGFHGLDLYSLYSSIGAVLRYLDNVDPDTAAVARVRYGCLSPWEQDPALYGRAALTNRYRTCENDVVAALTDLVKRRLELEARDGEGFFDAVQNARVVANAERYYRAMYYSSRESWNLRDRHMFETLRLLLAARGSEARAVVWEHNSHVGDAGATEMGARGETNVGMLSREELGDDAYIIGFGTDHGTVAAATDWDGEMEVKAVRPSHPDSYERVCHETGVPAFLLHLRDPRRPEVRDELEPPRLERAIGVIYRPETELASHYFRAVLPWQFDEYVWIDETTAVSPLAHHEVAGMPETYPFGL